MSASDILGKIGEKVGGEFSDLRVSLGTLYATKVSLGNVENTIDFTPYATNASISRLRNGQDPFYDLSADRASIGNLTVTGTTTTLNTETLNVEDNIIEVNLKSNGTETANVGGIEINRGQNPKTITVTGYGDFVYDYDSSFDMNEFLTGHTSTDKKETYTLEGDNPNGYAIVWYSNPNQTTNNLDTNSATWVMRNSSGIFKDFSGGSYNLTHGSSDFPTTEFTIAYVDVFDKAKFVWDNTVSRFKALLGTAEAGLIVSEIKVPDSNGVKINNISLGDYATFESAFNTANS